MATTSKLNDSGNIDFIDVITDQPVNTSGQDGRMIQIQGVTQDVTTKYTMSPDDVKLELVTISKRRTQFVNQHNTQLALLDKRTQVLNDGLALVPIDIAQPVGP